MPVFGRHIGPPRKMITRILGLPWFAVHVSRIMAGRLIKWWDNR